MFFAVIGWTLEYCAVAVNTFICTDHNPNPKGLLSYFCGTVVGYLIDGLKFLMRQVVLKKMKEKKMASMLIPNPFSPFLHGK